MSAHEKAAGMLDTSEAALKTTHTEFTPEHRPGKASATLKAQFALAGHMVHEGGNEDYIVVQANWGMSRHCSDFAALIAFARQIGVSQ